MKRILVIGASGYVGSYLTRRLLDDGFQVRCLVRNPDKATELKVLGCQVFKGDITDASSIQKATESIDAVYISIHTLVSQHPGTSGQGFMEIEKDGLAKVVEACRANNVHRLIYVTSLGISALSKDAWTKGRWEIQQYVLNSGLDVTIIQPGMIVGFGGRGFNTVLDNAQKKYAFVVGNGHTKLRTIAIDDLVSDLTGVLDNPSAYGKCFEVGNDDVLSGNQLIDIAAEVIGHPKPRKIHIQLWLLRFLAPLLERLFKAPKGSITGSVDGLKQDLVGDPSAIHRLLPRQRISYRQAVALAYNRSVQK